MKIDNTGKTVGPGPAGPRAAGVRPTATDVKPESAGAAETSTVVSAGLHSLSESEAAFDVQKVAEIRQAISDGKFQINPERIADSLIGSVREMLDRNRRPT